MNNQQRLYGKNKYLLRALHNDIREANGKSNGEWRNYGAK
jgi:hypothetical protein